MADRSQSGTRITRSWGSTLAACGVGAGLCGLAYFLVKSEHPVWATLSGIGALFLIFAGVSLSGTADCPTCARPLGKLSLMSMGSFCRCPHCHSYARDGGGWLRVVEDDCIAPEPAFSIYLPPDDFILPQLCCVCGRQATRKEELSLQLRSTSGAGFTEKEIHASLRAPHCDQHKGGARLTRETKETTTLFSQLGPVTTVLKVRSYAFYLEFCRRNGTP